MKQPIEEYLKRLKDFGYTQEQLEAVREFRESEETQHVDWEQFQFLANHGALKVTQKLKKIRNLYLRGDKVWFLNHYHRAYKYCAVFPKIEE